MISLVNQYKLEFATVPLEPEDGKVYFVSTEINPAADRFVEDNLEELREIFAREGLEFVFVRSKVGKDAHGRNVPPTVLSYAISKETDKGIAFSAYHVNLDKEELGEAVLTQLYDVARVYSRRSGSGSIRFRIAEDPETSKLLEEMERLARALKMKGIKPDVIDDLLSSLSKPGDLVVDMNGNLLVTDFGNVNIKLNPIEKALYLFLLQHPEGVEADAMVGYRKELLRIYRRFTIFDDDATIEDRLDNLLSEDKSALYTHISRINKRIKTKLGERGSLSYRIQFRRKPEPGRYLIDVPFDNIRWEQRF